MVQLEQGHIIIMAILLVIRVEEEADHLEGHLCVAGGILKIFAQVNGPDGGGGQSVGCRREDKSSHEQRRMGRAWLLLAQSFEESLIWVIISLRGASFFIWLLISRNYVGHLFDALICLYSRTNFGQTLIHTGNLLIFAYFP